MEFEKIKEIIIDIIDVSDVEITLDTRLKNDLGTDSLDFLQIASEIEEAFKIEFSEESANELETVGDVVNYVKKMSK
jgi:acyl carrier protein